MRNNRNGFTIIELMIVVAVVGILAAIAVPYFQNRSYAKQQEPVSTSGVTKADVKVQTGSDGMTVEQRNVAERLKRDNQAGSIKHLYIISAYSGQVLIYSTVRGKVSSSGKRLSPNTVTAGFSSGGHGYWGIPVNIGGSRQHTGEVLQDDGTYGSSAEYLFWFDSKDVYHQQYVTGGMILHVSDQPLTVKSVTINMEISNRNE